MNCLLYHYEKALFIPVNIPYSVVCFNVNVAILAF